MFSLASAPNSPGYKPLLKWAGGKSQLLGELLPRVPKKFGRYIEPFFGGGALFFALAPESAVIADSNPELINLYRSVARDVEAVIRNLSMYEHSESLFYAVRAQRWQTLSAEQAAARTIFLNKTCFNGLYRVNREGHFNVPWGKHKNPRFLDAQSLRTAAELLKRTTIVCGDYKSVLREHAANGDFVFLDPPYLPISKYADFKRYTREQFYEEDHRDLADEVERLQQLGCHTILTNSNHQLVHQLYRKHDIHVIETRRHISSKGSRRTGEDVIVEAFPLLRSRVHLVDRSLPEQVSKFPSTRFMGSKRKILEAIWKAASRFEFDTVIDLFSGSGVVGYMFKAQGKAVVSNDHMAMSAVFAKALIENSATLVSRDEAEAFLKKRGYVSDRFVTNTFQGLYFSDLDNRLIDAIRAKIKTTRAPYKRAIYMAALIRACMKKRPRGIFTYVGERYDDGRRDLQRSMREQFLDAVDVISGAVFDNGKRSIAKQGDALSVKKVTGALVYIDPPYYSPYSDNEYVRRYHFVEGIARSWRGVEIQTHTQTKKFKSYPTPFASRQGAMEAFDLLFRRFRHSKLIVSYSSNSQPTMDEMVELLGRYKSHVDVVPVKHRYSFGNQRANVAENRNAVSEYLFIGH